MIHIVVWTLMSCFADLHATEGPLVFLGDSLTAGYGVELEQAYPALVERSLRERGYGIRVVNAGISGDTTAGGKRRVDWVLKQKPLWVVVALGANDMLRGTSPSEAEKNLESIIRAIRLGGAEPILFGMRATPNLGREYRVEYDALFKRLAKRERVPLLDFFISDVAARGTLNQADGIHPTEEGHRRIASRVTEFLIQHLPGPGSRAGSRK